MVQRVCGACGRGLCPLPDPIFPAVSVRADAEGLRCGDVGSHGVARTAYVCINRSSPTPTRLWPLPLPPECAGFLVDEQRSVTVNGAKAARDLGGDFRVARVVCLVQHVTGDVASMLCRRRVDDR